MIYQGPYTINGITLEQMVVVDAVLTLRNMAPDELRFTVRMPAEVMLPADNEWVELRNATGKLIFTGLAKRKYQHLAKSWSYTCKNVYQGLLETDLLAVDGRPFVAYPMQDIGSTVRDIIQRAQSAGLPIQAPAELVIYQGPRMSYRSATMATALEDTLKWVPDMAIHMDYSTTPPTLQLTTRRVGEAVVLEPDADDSKIEDFDLEAVPETRALGLEIAYAVREGDLTVRTRIQSAGDLAAEARRKASVFLSGPERSDKMATEALALAKKAVAALAIADSNQALAFTFDALKALDSNLQAAATAQAGFGMYSAGSNVTLYTGINWDGSTWPNTDSYAGSPLYLADESGAFASGWYAIKSGAFTAEQLALVGAKQETRYVRGQFETWHSGEGSAGAQSLLTNAGSSCFYLTGYTQGRAVSSSDASQYWRRYVFYAVNIPVDAINMPPSTAVAKINAANAAAMADLAARADFVMPPSDLAANFFNHQDWMPYKGQIALLPDADVVPVPGNFVSITGQSVPEDYHSMATPVSETIIHLTTGRVDVNLGPSPRADYTSIADRLRIPIEDNYQPG